MPPICIREECPTPEACSMTSQCRKRRTQPLGRVQEMLENPLPRRVGIAIVDHDDNVLENGPYFSVAVELTANELEGLVRPLLARYAQRAGILSQEDAKTAARPQAPSNAAMAQGPGDPEDPRR